VVLEEIAGDGCIGMSVAVELHGAAMTASFGDTRGAGVIQFSLIAKNTEELEIQYDFVSPCKCKAKFDYVVKGDLRCYHSLKEA
jgi:hypothetical protein